MPDLGKILDVINRILELVFGKDIPSWLPQLVGIILLAVLVLFAIWGFLVFLSKIMKLWQEDLWPRFYNKERKSHVIRRQHFADHVESEIRRLNNLEVWSDYRFAELEAEVEAEVESRPSGVFRFFKSTQNTLRRERTLSRALAVSKSRLILLEGEPGSGKSVALRHVAQVLARRAMKSRNERAIIPVYINLKELDGPNEQAIDRNLIHAFVLKSLNRVNDRDIEEFLEKEFDQGLREGTWLFLFDSFDEIPEVLGSTESDKVIKSYIDAISDFLHGMNQCRGVVASRQFRGPGKIGWPNFRILPLSEERKLELVRKAEINNQMEKEIIGKLAIADANIFAMTNNPMFLGLLCEHVKHGNPFPENAHTVFESYISARFDRDRERLKKRFTKEVEDIRAVAESVAFCMTADARLGLSPTREKINSSLVKQHFGVDGDLDIFLDALEYTKLARSEKQTPGESQSFTFAHRRFQEYFSTSVVLRDPTRVSAKQLLTNARWRETAVVLLQTQSSHALSPIIKESRSKLKIITEKVEKQIAQAREYIKAISENRNTEKRIVASFPWPQGSIHSSS